MPAKPEDLLNPEAKKAFNDAMSQRSATVIRKAVAHAIPYFTFLISLLVFELFVNGFAIWLINNYLLPIDAEKYAALGLILAASISSGTTLHIAFYRYILRDLL